MLNDLHYDSFQTFVRKTKLLTLRLDIINKCNFRCVMCHYTDAGIRKRELSQIDLNAFESSFAKIMPYVGEIVLSCGDEPLMSGDFIEILKFISNLRQNIDISFCTNGSLLNSKIRDAIIEYGVTYLMFSIDGIKRSTFEKIRKGSSFDKVISNFKAMSALKERYKSPFPNITLNYVMMRSNIKESVLLLEIAKDLGASLIDYRHVVISQFWNDEYELLENHKSLYNVIRKKIIKKAKTLSIDVLLPDEYSCNEKLHFCVQNKFRLLNDYYSISPSEFSGKEITPKKFSKNFKSRENARDKLNALYQNYYCERPFTEIMIKQQSEISPCPWYKQSLGNIKNGDDVFDIFWGVKFNELRSTMLLGKPGDGCQNCPVKSNHLPQ